MYISAILLNSKISTDPIVRRAGGKVWKDPSLKEWPEEDYRVFVGNLGNEVSDEMLTAAFRQFASLNKVKVVRDKQTLKSRGYGFVSFGDPKDMLAALKDMHGKHIGNRPCTLKRSKWEDRNIDSSKNVSAIAADKASQRQELLSESARRTQKFKKIKRS